MIGLKKSLAVVIGATLTAFTVGNSLYDKPPAPIKKPVQSKFEDLKNCYPELNTNSFLQDYFRCPNGVLYQANITDCFISSGVFMENGSGVYQVTYDCPNYNHSFDGMVRR